MVNADAPWLGFAIEFPCVCTKVLWLWAKFNGGGRRLLGLSLNHFLVSWNFFLQLDRRHYKWSIHNVLYLTKENKHEKECILRYEFHNCLRLVFYDADALLSSRAFKFSSRPHNYVIVKKKFTAFITPDDFCNGHNIATCHVQPRPSALMNFMVQTNVFMQKQSNLLPWRNIKK